MFVIGLTGGIASGKSTVSKILAQAGAHIIDADKIAHDVVMPNQLAWQKIVSHFGMSIILENGQLDRAALGATVFSNPAQRKWLEELIHPFVRAAIEKEIQVWNAEKKEIVVLDIPLLYEAGWDTLADETWVVSVDTATQLKRLVHRDRLSLMQAQKRIDSQMPLTEKVKRADYVIDNMFDLAKTREQVLKRWNQIRKR
ncbi:dephospho-CoA kinase [Propionispira raffinosivorans]|uniref:dephospho-CoA kinase n=1 Tax=Propionispira raffinosivorans TaxID=86959 RepID=UPI0003713001|nr:dephospho-CoA kinase [Propionispira raffinosivorans]